MLTITKKQTLERWDDLPLILREALYSDVNSDFLWKTCQEEFIPEDKIYTVAKITGYVLTGFLHPEDMASEITDVLKIDRRIADPIASAINQRIFAPLRADIDKVYAPPGTSLGGPKIIEAEAMPAPIAPLSQPGWSKIPPTQIPLQTPAKISSIPAAAAMTPKASAPKPVGEFARLATTKTPTTSGSSGAKPGTPPPAPFMIQNNTNVKPIQNAPDFHSPTSTINIMRVPKMPIPAPSRPAIIEMGNKSSAAPKEIHYSDLKSPLPASLPTMSNKPPITGAGRQVTEITAGTAPIPVPNPPARPIIVKAPEKITFASPMPVPPSPAKSPFGTPMPKPPAPPTQQAPAKIITKDFLDGK